MIQGLYEWLDANKIQYKAVDDETIEIIGLGKVYVQDMDNVNSLFKKDKDDQYVFNCTQCPDELIDDGINHVVFQFGDNWYIHDLRKEFALNILKYVGKRKPLEHDIPFVNLGIHTPYELLNGSFMPQSWIEKAKYLGHTALGVCDRNTMASLFAFQKECEAAAITPVFGYSLTFTDGDNSVGAKVYVQTQQGLRNLLRIQKSIMVDCPEHTIDITELAKRGNGNVLILDKYSSQYIYENQAVIDNLKDSFNKVFYQVDLSEFKAERIDIQVLEATKFYFDNLYAAECVPPVMICDCYYLDKDDAKNKVILNKIAEGAAHEQSNDQYYKDADEHYAVFEQLFDQDKWDIDKLFRECCENTLYIAGHAEARFETGRNFMPEYDMTEEEKRKYGTTHNMFNQLLEEGLQRLVPAEKQEEYRKQMEYEKYIIESTNNVDYLLVQYDTVNWCKRNGILTGCGRGSAAGSLLLYLLGITLTDPLRYNLIFERFLLPERAGLYQAETTIIGEDIETMEYIDVGLEHGHRIRLDKDACLLVKRGGNDTPVKIYADELEAGDDILWDNKDELFTINELQI